MDSLSTGVVWATVFIPSRIWETTTAVVASQYISSVYYHVWERIV